MKSFSDMIKQARLRMLADRALRWAGWGLVAGIILSLGLLVMDRVAGTAVATFWYWCIPSLGLIAGTIYAAATQVEAFQTAIQVDRSLRLKDRIGTAVSIESAQGGMTIDSEFAQYVRAEANRLVGRVDLKAATPIRMTGVWMAGFALTAILWGGVLFLPAMAARNLDAKQPQGDAALAPQQQQLAQTIAETIENIPPDMADDQQTAENIDALSRLSDQFNQPLNPEEARAAQEESAARLTELANQLAQQAERDREAMEELTRRFQTMKSPDANEAMPSLPQEIAQSLREGKWDEAAQRIDRVVQNAQDEPLTQRQLTAEQLRQLSRELENAMAADPRELNERTEQLKQALQDQNVDEQTADRMLNEPDAAEEMEQALREANVDPEVARDIAEDAQQLQRERQASEDAEHDARDLGEALERAADEVESPTAPKPEPQTQPHSPATQPQSQTRPQPSPSQPSEDKSSSSQPQSKQESTANEKSQDEGEQKENSTARDDPGNQTQTQPDRSQSQEKQRGDKPEPQQRSERDAPEEQSTQPSTNEEQKSNSKQSPDQSASNEQRESGEPSTQPDSSSNQRETSQPTNQGQPRESNQSQEPRSTSPSETLRRLAERMQKNQDQRQSAERLRELAKELMENTTPEERQRWLEEWKKQNQQQPTPENPPQPEGEEGELTPEQKQMLEQLRETGKEMWDKMSAEERQQMMDQMRKLQNQNQPQGSSRSSEQSGDPRTSGGADPQADSQRGEDRDKPSSPMNDMTSEDVDLRGDELAQQPIMQWLNKNAPAPTGRATASENAPQVSKAQEFAERAVEDSVVQKRYHKMIKRYFGRLNQTIDKAAGEPGATTQPSR
jgi:hypothetical protein